MLTGMSSVPPGEPAEGDQPVEPTPLAGFRSRGLRPGQLLSLMGLTGFAISQPLLALAGENPTVFTFANLSGSDLVVFSLAIALVPPLVLWLATVGIGSLSQRAGDSFFAGTAVLLTGLAAVQWSKALGLEATVAVAVAATLVAIAFGVALTRVPAVAEWTRYTAILPVLSVFLLLFTSPSSQLLAGPAEISDPTNQAGPQPDVVMVMLDELPLESMLDADGQIDEVGSPIWPGWPGTRPGTGTTPRWRDTPLPPCPRPSPEPGPAPCHRCGLPTPATCSACWPRPTN